MINIYFLLIQMLVIVILLFIFVWQCLILIAIRNAVINSKIPAPLFWLFIAIGNLVFVIMTLIFALTVQL